jgi:hypothetical protein
MAVSFIGGGNRRTRRKPQGCRKYKIVTGISFYLYFQMILCAQSNPLSCIKDTWIQSAVVFFSGPVREKALLTVTPMHLLVTMLSGIWCLPSAKVQDSRSDTRTTRSGQEHIGSSENINKMKFKNTQVIWYFCCI